MISRDPQYQRLTRTGRSFYRQASFWLGADHLLSVHIDGYTERYQRFAYRDIQALLIHPTRYFLWVNVVAGLLLLPEVFMFFLGASEVRSLAGVFVVPLLIILAVNLFREIGRAHV